MKVKMIEILDASKVLRKISKQDLQKGFAKIGYILYKNIQSINKEIGYFEETKNKIISKYGKKDVNGKYITDDSGNIIFTDYASAQNELNDVLQIEVDCNISKFSLEELNNWSMSVQDISKIAFMIEDK